MRNGPARSWAFFFLLVLFLTFASVAYTAEPRAIQVPRSLQKQLKSFEPSAAVYLEDQGSYLLASDDTDEDDSPWLFLMDRQGRVQSEPLSVLGVEKITDIESL